MASFRKTLGALTLPILIEFFFFILFRQKKELKISISTQCKASVQP